MDLVKKFFRSKKYQETEEPNVFLYVPALVAILSMAEQKKGAPLDEDEVLSIRDNAVGMTMTLSEAQKMVEGRGYSDIAPENVWDEWNAVRQKLQAP